MYDILGGFWKHASLKIWACEIEFECDYNNEVTAVLEYLNLSLAYRSVKY